MYTTAIALTHQTDVEHLLACPLALTHGKMSAVRMRLFGPALCKDLPDTVSLAVSGPLLSVRLRGRLPPACLHSGAAPLALG